MTCTVGTAGRPAEHALDDDRAVILLVGGEYVEIDRHRGTAEIHATRALDDHDVVHPYLASPAGVFAQWSGRLALHAGGVIIEDGAWALLGEKGAGKTTMLAELHRRGYGIVADDMMVLMDGVAFAGPRCLDLRPQGPSHLQASDAVRTVRDGERTRLALPAIPGSVPFHGWIVLQDASTVEVLTVPLTERLGHLRSQLMMGVRPTHAGLELLGHLMWAVRRPRTWSALPAAVDALLAAVTRSGG